MNKNPKQNKDIKNDNNYKNESNQIKYNLYQTYPSPGGNNNNLYNNNIDLNNNSNNSIFYQNLNNYNSFSNHNNLYNNETFSYSDIKYIIRNEFTELMMPYQNQINNINNSINEKIDNSETRLKALINSKSLDNINEAAKMINIFMKDFNINIQNNNIIHLFIIKIII
jgi:hypothetical protein